MACQRCEELGRKNREMKQRIESMLEARMRHWDIDEDVRAMVEEAAKKRNVDPGPFAAQLLRLAIGDLPLRERKSS